MSSKSLFQTLCSSNLLFLAFDSLSSLFTLCLLFCSNYRVISDLGLLSNMLTSWRREGFFSVLSLCLWACACLPLWTSESLPANSIPRPLWKWFGRSVDSLDRLHLCSHYPRAFDAIPVSYKFLNVLLSTEQKLLKDLVVDGWVAV